MYRIHSVELTRFRRMLLNNISKITITPASAVQLILGTNGCGKSSLLEQLSPLPAEKDAFAKGGGKVVTIFQDGVKFVCSSKLENTSMHHSFVIDGVEENESGNVGVQLQLCKKYFRVTPATHALIRGVEKFTQMRPADRQDWLTTLCEADYTFALSAYEALKKRENVLAGAVKTNKKHLVTEMAKIMSEAEEAKLENEVVELKQELAILQAERMPVAVSSERHLDNRTRALKMLDDVSLKLLRLRLVVPLEYSDGKVERDEWGQVKKASFASIEEIDKEIDRLKHIVTGHQHTLVALNAQFTKHERQHNLLIQTGAEGVDSINRQIETLRGEITQRVTKMRLGLVFHNAEAAQHAFDGIEMGLTDVLRELPSNENRKYGRAKHEELQNKLLKVNETLRNHNEHLQRLTAQKEHADVHRGQDKHTCPKCDHTWAVGINEEQYDTLVARIKGIRSIIESVTLEQQEYITAIKEIEAYFDKYREVMGYTKTVLILKPFWDHVIESQLLFDAPIEIVNMLRQLKSDLVLAVDVEHLNNKIDELIKLRGMAAEVGDANLTEVRVQMDLLTERLGLLTSNVGMVSRAVAAYTDYRRQLVAGVDLAEEVKRLQKMAADAQWDHIEAFRRESIHECIRQVETALALKEESLRAARRQRDVVDTLQKMVSQDEVRELAAKTMVNALSPKTGLIAEGLLGFIRNFVGEMNTFISRVWAYPLQIIPTGYDMDNGEQSTELDYKFKMIVEREDNIVSDVTKGSDGIKEIVDMSFKIVGMKYSGLLDTPLMLDEPGKTFDDAHRFALTEEIRWMMENGNFPQLWMISHYPTNYSAFSNSEFCVIDDRNVSIPSGKAYNQHVKIVH